MSTTKIACMSFGAAVGVSVLSACAGAADHGGSNGETASRVDDVAATSEGLTTARADDSRGRRLSGDVLLVHGAWADGSSWNRVIEVLQRDGVTVHAVQLREQTLADDVALVRNAIGQLPGPLVVAGHSYGGAVVSGASTGQTNVSGLVFVAAYAPDEKESLGQLNALYAATPIGTHLVFDNQFNATVDLPGILDVFAPDVSRTDARGLYVTQHPLAGQIFGEPAGAPGWTSIRSYFAVSKFDQVISPDLERFLATRMKAKTIEIPSSHVSLLSHPREVAELIERAVEGK